MGTCCASGESSIATAPHNASASSLSTEQTNNYYRRSVSKKMNEEFWNSLEPNIEIGNILKDVPIFSRVESRKRNKLAGAMEEEIFGKNDYVFKQGDNGDKFYIICEGVAAVIVTMPNTNRHVEVARLKKGDYFGETALLSNKPRNATIKAIDDKLVLLSLDSDRFCRLFKDLKLRLARRKGVMEHNKDKKHEVTVDDIDEDKLQTAKSEEEIELITESLNNSVLFEQLDNDQIKLIALSMAKKLYRKGEILIDKHRLSNYLFIINTGVITHLSTKPMVDQGKIINQIIRKSLTFGTIIGELNLMYNSCIEDTYEVDIDAEIFLISRKKYRNILKTSSNEKFAEYEQFLKNVELFEGLLNHERHKIAEALNEIHFKAGHAIIKEGNVGNSFYIIRNGSCSITKTAKGETVPKEVAIISNGDYFGERSLIKHELRAATVTATSELDCLFLDRNDFTKLLGPLTTILERKINKDYDDNIRHTDSDVMNESITNTKLSNAKVDILIDNLEIIGILGKGSFGVVQLMKLREPIITNPEIKYIALKIVHKPNVVQLNQQEHILNEKKVLMCLNSKFIINLYCTDKDKYSLYFFLEPILGGELFSYLRDLNIFDEEQSKFYAACVVEAFDHLHKQSIIYRDLKPENLLIHSDGYLKITDFGFAKFVHSRTFTLCGTPDYLAPEVISGTGHNKGFDWWTLGILIYEMMEGLPPFYNENPMQTYAKIMHGSIKFTKRFNKSVIDLIKNLLQPKATKRLGCLISGTNGVRQHAWFNGFDWNGLIDGTIEAPIIPDIKSMEDLSNFDDYSDNDRSEDPEFDNDNCDWDNEF